jgi:redox-sensitive bicupin YhaK (pirin superfamily)
VSGPLEEREIDPGQAIGIEVRQGRSTQLGGLDIERVLPTKGRRTVGPWCFVDLMTQDDLMDPPPMEIGPHPHTGLATVTWLFAGEAVHTDSLGTEQPIRPGQLNLMTAGHGIAHAEEGVRGSSSGLQGVQMWLAQPEGLRHGSSHFQHHAGLPVVELDDATARVFIGTLGGAASPARVDSPTLGVELTLARSAISVVADPSFEHALVPIDNPVKIEEVIVEPGWIGVLPTGRNVLVIEASVPGSRAMLLGGAPIGERIQMWWNFVARTREEITDAWKAWDTGNVERFGPVPSRLERIQAPRPPWV